MASCAEPVDMDAVLIKSVQDGQEEPEAYDLRGPVGVVPQKEWLTEFEDSRMGPRCFLEASFIGSGKLLNVKRWGQQ